MYGSPVSKDLNQPPPPTMNSSGLLRYRSAPSTLLGEVCEEFLPRAASPDAAADVFSRFLADHQIRDSKPPTPPPPSGAHFADEAAAAMASQQMMFQHHQQQQMAPVDGLYRTVSSGGMDVPAAAGAGASSLLRQSSSPAGFLNHLNLDNG
jgi:hypothetical protein